MWGPCPQRVGHFAASQESNRHKTIAFEEQKRVKIQRLFSLIVLAGLLLITMLVIPIGFASSPTDPYLDASTLHYLPAQEINQTHTESNLPTPLRSSISEHSENIINLSSQSPKAIVRPQAQTKTLIAAPVFSFTNSANVSTASVGATVIYSFILEHDPGSDGTPVSGIAITDTVLGVISGPQLGDDGDNVLELGETWTYTKSYVIPPNAQNLLTNNASVSGNGGTVTDSDGHTLDVAFNPVLLVTKSVNAGTSGHNVGDTVNYTYQVTHDPTSDGSPVSITSINDDKTGTPTMTGGDTNTNNTLDQGEIWTYTDNYVIQPEDPNNLVNMVTVTGTDRDVPADTIQDSHSASWDVNFLPVLEIEKQGPISADVGVTVDYIFKVKHAGSR